MLIYTIIASCHFQRANIENILLRILRAVLLLVGYLVERQIVVRRLRREVAQAQVRYSELHGRAREVVVGCAGGTESLEDRLVMELEPLRLVRVGLSVMVVRLLPRPINPPEIAGALGDAVKALVAKVTTGRFLVPFFGGYLWNHAAWRECARCAPRSKSSCGGIE